MCTAQSVALLLGAHLLLALWARSCACLVPGLSVLFHLSMQCDVTAVGATMCRHSVVANLLDIGTGERYIYAAIMLYMLMVRCARADVVLMRCAVLCRCGADAVQMWCCVTCAVLCPVGLQLGRCTESAADASGAGAVRHYDRSGVVRHQLPVRPLVSAMGCSPATAPGCADSGWHDVPASLLSSLQPQVGAGP